MTTVNYKKLYPNSVDPKQMTTGAAGFDLTAVTACKVGNVWEFGVSPFQYREHRSCFKQQCRSN